MKSPVRLGRSVLVFGRNGSFAPLCRAPKCRCSRARCPSSLHTTRSINSRHHLQYPAALAHLVTRRERGRLRGRQGSIAAAVSATGSPICQPSRSSGPIALPSHGPPHCTVDARTQGGAIPTQPSLRIYGCQFPYRLSPLITCQFPSS